MADGQTPENGAVANSADRALPDDKAAAPASAPSTASGPGPAEKEKTERSSATLSSRPSLAGDTKDTAVDVEARTEKHEDPRDEPSRDPNIVDFDGPDDPAKAVNWTSKKKWTIISILSVITFITPLASSMFAPGIPQVLRDFESDSTLLGSFVVSVYVLGYASGPAVIAPLSELFGRQLVYNVTNALFIIFTVACAVASNLNMLIGFRFLEGVAGSAAISLGGGTVADLFVQEQRGRAMALWSVGPLIGPVVGPIAGGFLTQALGWRWVFWIITMAAGVVSIACFLFSRETYATVILKRKTEARRKATGNPSLRSALDRGLTPAAEFKLSIVRPLKMLAFSPIVLLLSTHTAVTYGYLYLLFTTVTFVFEYNYGFGQGVVGLTYLGLGVGMFTGLGVFGFLSDRLLKKKAGQGEMKPEYRLNLMLPGAVCIPIGLFIYGWSAEYGVHWFVPIFGTSFVGMGLIGTFVRPDRYHGFRHLCTLAETRKADARAQMPIMTYLVDAFPIYAASATAANTIWRSIVGALLPLAGPPMYARLGLGWGNSLLGFIAIAMLPIPILLERYGERIRKNPKFQPNL